MKSKVSDTEVLVSDTLLSKELPMMKKIMAIVCISAIFFASPAFAYKRDVPQKEGAEETTTEEYKPEQAPQPVFKTTSGGNGVETFAYVLIGLGGAAAITGSTFAVATNKRLTGAIIGASGAALGLTGSLMLLLGSSHGGYYGLSPEVDPTHGTYGLAFAGNF